MRFARIRTRRLRSAALPALFIFLLAYFFYHAVQGEYGLLALKEIDARADKLAERAAELRAERRALEARVALLRPDQLDPDMLDEQARRRLGFVRPGEIVILNPGRETATDASKE